jgi:hypothetical protein
VIEGCTLDTGWWTGWDDLENVMPASVAPDDVAALLIPDGTPAWLGVSRDERERSTFYAITIEFFDVSALTDGESFTFKFSSDDDIDSILKTVRSNEVWGKPVDFTIIRLMTNLFDEFTIIRLQESSLTHVSKSNKTYSWTILCRQARVMGQK